MFSEYASRLIQQSHMRLSQNHTKPLFYSNLDDTEDIRESMALRQSRAGTGGRFGAFKPMNESDEQERYDDNDHAAMRSSWIPPHGRRASVPIRSRSNSGSSSGAAQASDITPEPPMQSDGNLSDRDDESDIGDEPHSEAPDDIMYGVPLDDSIPPQSLAGSPPMRSFKMSNERRQPTHEDENVLDETDSQVDLKDGSQESLIPELLAHPELKPIYHDSFYAALFMVCQASAVATSIFVWLRTDLPATPMSDSLYSALNSSMGLIVKDVFLALAIAMIWLLTMRSFVKSLLYVIIVAVPLVLFSFSLYSLVSSYRTVEGGFNLQARAMRWSSFFTACFAGAWVYTSYTRRYAMTRAVAIIKLACTILEQNPWLVLMSLANLAIFVLYSFIWLEQFERIFLRGSFSGVGNARRFLVEGDSWLMGAYFILIFLWTFGIFSGVQRAATSAVVSQWYFHRHALPKISQKEVVKAGLLHALSSSFGTICASSIFALMTRLPLLALPRRMSGLVSLAAYMLLSAPIFSLTSPLTLSYAAIHSIDIGTAATGINRHPSLNPASSWGSYRTAKMLLSAARATTALALGTGAWVSLARGSEGRGSLYAYIVGLATGAIGWAVVGTVEGMVSMIVDAAFVCYSIDLTNAREGRSHCLEAVASFGTGPTNDGALQV